jgi:hypothetical protein
MIEEALLLGRIVTTSSTRPGVLIGPGLRVLMRMLRPLTSSIQLRANARTAALDAAYTLNAGVPLLAAVEPVKMTEAPSPNKGNAACTVNSVPFTLRPKVSSKCSSVISPSGASEPPPALATSTFSLPCSARMRSNSACNCDESAESTRTLCAVPPMALTARSSSACRRPVM